MEEESAQTKAKSKKQNAHHHHQRKSLWKKKVLTVEIPLFIRPNYHHGPPSLTRVHRPRLPRQRLANARPLIDGSPMRCCCAAFPCAFPRVPQALRPGFGWLLLMCLAGGCLVAKHCLNRPGRPRSRRGWPTKARPWRVGGRRKKGPRTLQGPPAPVRGDWNPAPPFHRVSSALVLGVAQYSMASAGVYTTRRLLGWMDGSMDGWRSRLLFDRLRRPRPR